ncbi:MAG: hypothetical protein D6718_11155 [Acidobacteria bacterium]|nr:MAG: hypothetical protein D6718_11155 [Acidobacteriota bacterium]
MGTSVASRVAPEIRSVQERKFAALMRRVLEQNAFYRSKFEPAGLRPGKPAGLSVREHLPYTRRGELLADQRAHPPLGTNLSFPAGRYTRLHEETLPDGQGLVWADTAESWRAWLDCWCELYRKCGVTAEDRVLVAASEKAAPAFRAAADAAAELGALALGPAWTARRAADWLRHRPTAVVLPAETAVEIAAAAGGSSGREIRLVLAVTGRDLAAVEEREAVAAAWRAECRVLPSSVELGSFGWDCGRREGVHLLETELVAEVVDPDSLSPATPDASGRVRGELVLTTLWREGSPVIRYLTGTRVVLDRSPCPCGARTAVVRPL